MVLVVQYLKPKLSMKWYAYYHFESTVILYSKFLNLQITILILDEVLKVYDALDAANWELGHLKLFNFD